MVVGAVVTDVVVTDTVVVVAETSAGVDMFQKVRKVNQPNSLLRSSWSEFHCA